MPPPGVSSNRPSTTSAAKSTGSNSSSTSSSARVDTSSLSGIERASRQPSQIDTVRNTPSTEDNLKSQSTPVGRLSPNNTPTSNKDESNDNQPPIAAIAGTAAQDNAVRTAPPSPETRLRNTPESAAFDALAIGNRQSINTNLEFGGLVYQDQATGKFGATNPIAGDATGFDPGKVNVPNGNQRNVVGDYHTHGDYSVENSKGNAVRTSNAANDVYNSDNFSQTDYHGIRADAAGTPNYKGYLGTPSGEFQSFDPAVNVDPVTGDDFGTRMGIPGENVRGSAKTGAATGATIELVRSSYSVLSDGYQAGDANKIATATAGGATAGAAQEVGEHYAERFIDQRVGSTIQRTVTNAATREGLDDAVRLGTGARMVASKVGGAGAVGAVVGAGFSIYENREALAQGDSEAIGDVAGDTVVAAGSAIAGAAAGAAIGSVVPVVGTAAGAVIGLAVGFGADYIMRKGGVDEIVGDAVTSTVDAAKSVGKKISSWFGG